MDFIVLGTAAGHKNYLHRKMQAAAAAIGQNEVVPPSADTAMPHKPHVALPQDFFTITERQQTLIEVAQRCALREVTDEWPLLEGEEVEQDFFTYLLEPYHQFPAYTAVILRKTNMAEIAYIFGLVQIDNGDVKHTDAGWQPAPNMPRAFLSPKTMEYIKKLLSAGGVSAASAVGGKLGTMLLNLVMKEVFGVDNDTEQLLTEVRKIVHEEIESNEMARIEGTLIGTLDYLATKYRRLKSTADLSNAADRKELVDYLTPLDTKMYTDVIGLLKTDKYSRRGIKTFMMAASIHLVLTQEMALVDPKHMNPNDSGYLLTMRDLAVNYKSFVRGVYDRAMADRNRMNTGTEAMNLNPRGPSPLPDMYWIDHVSGQRETGFKKSKDPVRSAEENATVALEAHRTQVLNKLKEEMGNPPDTFLVKLEGFINFKFQV